MDTTNDKSMPLPAAIASSGATAVAVPSMGDHHVVTEPWSACWSGYWPPAAARTSSSARTDQSSRGGRSIPGPTAPA
jgi:hypothetical protein